MIFGMGKGWIKLHRSLLDWQYYGSVPCKLLLIHLLVSVNYEDKRWQGTVIKAGSLVTTHKKLANEIGLTIRQIRYALNTLESCQEIVTQTTNRFSVISLVKWEELQGSDNETAGKLSDKRQASGTQMATTKEVKKLRSNTIINFKDFLEAFNQYFGKRHKVVTDKAQRQIKNLLKTYTRDDINYVFFQVKSDKNHIENNFKYVTPEFISRPDKFESFLGRGPIK